MSNCLLSSFKTPYELPPFEKISHNHYREAIEQSLEEGREEIDRIIQNPEVPSFENVVEKLEYSGEKLKRNASILFNLNSAETNDQIQKVAQDISPMLSAFDSEVKQNSQLFKKVKQVYDQQISFEFTDEQKKILHETYFEFVRRGVGLEKKKKERFREISIELSKLTLSFSEHVLAETNQYELVVTNEADISGLPNDAKERAKDLAIRKGKENAWMFTLQAPSYIPFMEYIDNRSLREKMYRAYMCRCIKGDANDNQKIILKTIRLKAELASLLGYSSFADYILEQRMAETSEKVLNFLNDFLDKSTIKAKEEVEELKKFIQLKGDNIDLQRWDWAYYSEKLRKEKYQLDDELIKPYFKLENVIEGVFKTAEKLYDISFKLNEDLPIYHKEVKAYEVTDKFGEVISILYIDLFPRDSKRGGAWMTSYRSAKYQNEKRIIPQVSIVCNFTPSSSKYPSLLKFNEVKTIFHEFGHALHGMLSDTKYESLSGTNVYWDFVEFPSQIMENWCYEKDCLDLFAKHYETGENIPQRLIDQIRHSSTYHEAYATVRQLSFGLLDMAWHRLSRQEADAIGDATEFEDTVLASTELFPKVEGTNMSVQFSHIFAGGYAAGYYSYKWAEVLDADAFSVFQKNGVFDKSTADSFKENILSKGGTAHPMELYKKFRGREPTAKAFLERAGLT